MNRKLLLVVTLMFLFLPSLTPAFAKTQSNITGTFESETFEFTNMSAIYDPEGYSSTYEIVGIARNIGNSTYSDIQLSVELFDNNNTLIGVEKGSPNFDLGPGDESAFKVSTSESVKNSDLDHFRITVAGIKDETVNNTSNFGSTMPTKDGYDKCSNFAGKSFCDAIIYTACVEKAKESVPTVFNQTTCDGLLKTLKSNHTQNATN